MFRFRVLTPLILLALAIGFTACSDDPEPTTDGSSLIVAPDTVRLSATDSSKTADLTLTCGCGFTNIVESMVGDTNTIKYDMLDDMNSNMTKHSMRFHYSPSDATVPVSPLTLNFKATKQSYHYTNKVVVLVTP
jgi:hypothetical protein